MFELYLYIVLAMFLIMIVGSVIIHNFEYKNDKLYALAIDIKGYPLFKVIMKIMILSILFPIAILMFIMIFFMKGND